MVNLFCSGGKGHVANAVKAQVKLVKEYTDTVKEELQALDEYRKYIEKTIKEIESLPAELQKLYAGCLADLKASLKSLV